MIFSHTARPLSVLSVTQILEFLEHPRHYKMVLAWSLTLPPEDTSEACRRLEPHHASSHRYRERAGASRPHSPASPTTVASDASWGSEEHGHGMPFASGERACSTATGCRRLRGPCGDWCACRYLPGLAEPPVEQLREAESCQRRRSARANGRSRGPICSRLCLCRKARRRESAF